MKLIEEVQGGLTDSRLEGGAIGEARTAKNLLRGVRRMNFGVDSHRAAASRSLQNVNHFLSRLKEVLQVCYDSSAEQIPENRDNLATSGFHDGDVVPDV